LIKMKNKAISRFLIIVFLLTTFFAYLAPGVAKADTNINDLATQAVRNIYGLHKAGKAVDGGWGNFSSYDSYVLKLAGADLNTWVYNNTSLKLSVIALIDATIANEGTASPESAKRVAQDYLAAKALGENVKAAQLLGILQARQIVTGNGSFNNNAFSDIAAFEMLGRAGDMDKIAATEAITYILDQQDIASGAWTDSWQDVMATAEAIRALKYLEPYAAGQGAAVTSAINSGCTWLQARQQDSGGFCDATGFDDPAIDTSEVIYTLKLLGIEPNTWSKGGKTSVDYLQNEALNADKTFGTSKNLASDTWVLDAYLKLGVNMDGAATLVLKVEPASAAIAINATQQYTAKVYSLDGSLTDVTGTASWSSENATVASINNGLVQGLIAGQTNIRAAFDGVVGTVTLTVTSNGGSPSQNIVNYIEVYIAVVGKDGGLLFGPGSVRISKDDAYGLTAMSALDATGLSWSFKTGMDGFIEKIAGETNAGMNGWCGKKNSSPFWDVPQAIPASQGDKFIFWYSMNADFNGPNWNDLLSGNITQSKIPTIAEEKIKETLNSYKDELDKMLKDINPANKINILQPINVDKKMTWEKAKQLKEELGSNQVVLSKEVGGADVAWGDKEVTLLIPENALSQIKTITVKELPSNEEPQQFGIKLGSSTYEFGPSGTKFDKPITISIKVALTEDLNIESLSPAWYDETSKQWITIPGVIDYSTGLVVFRIDHFTKFAVIELPKATKELTRIYFKDVDDNLAWAKDAIEILAGQGVIKGTGQGLFEPQRSISRAEFVQLLVTALQLKTDEYKNGLFSDVDASNCFAASVACAYSNKFVSGYPDGTFKPDNSISRNEVASIFHHIEGIAGSINDSNMVFKDGDSIPTWASNGIKFVYQQGIMQGYEDGTFKGINPLSRAEAAVVVYKYLNTVSKI
jgi:PKD repeat protein